MIAAVLLLVAIFVAFATLREKKRAEESHRDGDRAFRLHTHALYGEAKR